MVPKVFRDRPLAGTNKHPEASAFIVTESKTPSDQQYDDDISPHPPRRHASTLQSIAHNWWLWELVSCLFSVGCIAAIAGILKRFDSQPLPSWPFGITLNALISLLAVVGKSAMLVVVASCIGQLRWNWFTRGRSLADFELFDAASRGPGGAAWLLLRTLPTHLVTLAGVIMVAALAFEPFVQQVVAYGAHRIAAPGAAAAVPRAQAYDNGKTAEFGSGGMQLGPESGMKAAVYQGLFGAVSEGPTPSCSTGNCSFPIFPSLAVCSQCLNVTDQTTRRSTRLLNGTDDNGFVYRHNVTYDLPGDVSHSIVYGSYDDMDPPDLSFGPAMSTQTKHSSQMTKESFNVSQPLVAISMLQFPYVNEEGYDGRYANGRPLAYECALYFCMQTFSIDVTNGQPSTEVLSSWHDPNLSPVNYDVPGTFEVDQNKMPLPSDYSKFTVPVGTISTVSNWLNESFSGQCLVDISVVAAGTYVNDVMQLFSETKDISALFANVSGSMTNYIRSIAPSVNGSSFAQGTAYKMESLVHVHWKWFILPIALAALTCVLFVATIAVTARRGVQVWKNNSLPILYHGLDSGLRESPRCSTTQMTEQARGEVVRLARPDEGSEVTVLSRVRAKG